MDFMLNMISKAVIDGDDDHIAEMTQAALAQGLEAKQILDHALMPGMEEVSRRFSQYEIFLPEVLMSANAMQEGLNVLKSHLVDRPIGLKGDVVIGTVEGDMHDIGKNLVVMMLEGAGFEVHDLGRDVSVEEFVTAVRDVRPQVVGLSTLLTTSMPAMARVIRALQEVGLRDTVKVMVGGAPVSSDFARMIGADAYGPDARSAARLATQFVGGS